VLISSRYPHSGFDVQQIGEKQIAGEIDGERGGLFSAAT